MEVQKREKNKNKYKDKPLPEYEFLEKNVFEGNGFSICSFSEKVKYPYPKRRKAELN